MQVNQFSSSYFYSKGDYLKFVQTTSYTVAVMLLALRDYDMDSNLKESLTNETLHGLTWLLKMWDNTQNKLYYQVGIGKTHFLHRNVINEGDGNGNTILGDHDYWRLPEDDDTMQANVGSSGYYVKHR